MSLRLTRRRMLQGSAALGASAVAGGLPRVAFAANDKVAVRVERDIQNLDPANRIGAVEGNILRAVQPRLAKFKSGTFEWEPADVESIKQVDEKTIEFTLKKGMKWEGDYGEVTAEDVKFSFERFNIKPEGGELPTYAKDWGALDHVEAPFGQTSMYDAVEPRMRGAQYIGA